MKKSLIMTAALLACLSSPIYAQEVCEDPECELDTLNISTGFNQMSGTYLNPTVLEQNWQLTSVPTGCNINVPNAPSFIVPPYTSSWSSFSNAKWVSPFPTSAMSYQSSPT